MIRSKTLEKMQRDEQLERLKQEGDPWDFLIIGGGATGLGSAVEAASRGYRVVLVEQHDFAKGTSSRSTKLLHGGVRYLKNGDISLVRSALRERGFACRNAPHLSRALGFIIPAYKWHDKLFYGAGLTLYDRLSGRLSLGHSSLLSRKETLCRLPGVNGEGLRGGIRYTDGQFDDARMAVSLVRTAVVRGAVALNYARVTGLIMEGNRVRGARVRDEETGEELAIRARCVINAAGVFSDRIRTMETPDEKPMLVASQGSHLVLPRRFLPGSEALMVPKTDDGRVLFALPWQNRVVVGTTDLPVEEPSLEPRPLEQEIEFLLTHAARYLGETPEPDDVCSAFSGLRPLIKVSGGKSTAALSRDHTIVVSNGGLVTVLGGKWTTYRLMGEDAVNQAETVADVAHRPSLTRDLRLHGSPETALPDDDPFAVYGMEAPKLRELIARQPELGKPLHPRLDAWAVQVVWAARYEMARSVEDVLARRTRALLQDAAASTEVAPEVARLLAAELHRDSAWEAAQVREFRNLASGYLLAPVPMNSQGGGGESGSKEKARIAHSARRAIEDKSAG